MALAAPTATVSGYGRGIACQLIAVLLFSTMGALIKGLGDSYSTSQIIFFRSLPALIPLLFYLPMQGGWSALKTQRPGLQSLRAAIGLGSMYAGFYALAHMEFANYVTISFSAPLFGTLLAIPFLGEKVGIRRLTAVLVGFVGVVLAMRPAAGGFDVFALFAVGGAFCYGVVMVIMRQLGSVDRSAATVFYFTLLGVLVSAVFLPAEWVWPTPADWMLLIAVGALGGVAQIFMTEAFRLAPTSVVAPFDYTAMIWAVIFGYLMFDSLPTTNVVIGATVVCASGLFIIYRETKLGLSKPKVKRTAL